MSKVFLVTKENFEEEVMHADKPVLLDFSATWCGPCQMLAPVLEEIAEEGTVKVCKVDVDDQRQLAGEFGVDAIPALFAVKEGKIVNESRGFQPKASVLKLFE